MRNPIFLPVIIALIFLTSSSVHAQQGNPVPAAISDVEFSRLISEYSEPDAPYRYESLISNEASIQNVIPALKQLTRPGGVFLGVAPEQNFTYISALRSNIAFIIDIRRQNMLEHLVYKAVFEMSPTRADFVGRLFSRKRPAGLHEKSTAAALFSAYEKAPTDDLSLNLQALRSTIASHGYMEPDELLKVELVENPRGVGLILQTEVASDGSFVFRNVQPRTYSAIVLKTCKNCEYSTGIGTPVNIVVSDKDITALQLTLPVR